jgi:hypothetical protein
MKLLRPVLKFFTTKSTQNNFQIKLLALFSHRQIIIYLKIIVQKNCILGGGKGGKNYCNLISEVSWKFLHRNTSQFDALSFNTHPIFLTLKQTERIPQLIKFFKHSALYMTSYCTGYTVRTCQLPTWLNKPHTFFIQSEEMDVTVANKNWTVCHCAWCIKAGLCACPSITLLCCELLPWSLPFVTIRDYTSNRKASEHSGKIKTV